MGSWHCLFLVDRHKHFRKSWWLHLQSREVASHSQSKLHSHTSEDHNLNTQYHENLKYHLGEAITFNLNLKFPVLPVYLHGIPSNFSYNFLYTEILQFLVVAVWISCLNSADSQRTHSRFTHKTKHTYKDKFYSTVLGERNSRQCCFSVLESCVFELWCQVIYFYINIQQFLNV